MTISSPLLHTGEPIDDLAERLVDVVPTGFGSA
jgi:hypothetical protein